MIKFLTNHILFIFDFFHKRKIIKFLNKSNFNSFNIFLDIGAHKGESIEFFSKHLKIKKIYSFEASSENFIILKKKFQNNKFLFVENIALSSKIAQKIFYQCDESSSSTLSKINKNSNYFKKKMKYFGFVKPEDFFKQTMVKTNTLDNYLDEKKITAIDLIKLDTEGHELEILKGLGKKINNVKIIIFEHHFDNMLEKNYTFSVINEFLKKNYFKRIFKIKMPFRKSFEYIYINSKLN